MQYPRQQYMEQLIRKRDNRRIKVITGLRRSGKFYLLFTLYRQYLLENGIHEDQLISLALDEIDNIKYRNPFELNKAVKESRRSHHSSGFLIMLIFVYSDC